MRSKYTPEDAIRTITRTGGKVKNNKIVHKSPGLKVLSAIDYLKNYHNYLWVTK